MQVHLQTLGCRLNEAEIESWATGFIERGHKIVPADESPDIFVINTCAVTQSAVRKSRQLIRKTHVNNPNAKLVVSGCYATLNESESTQIDGVDLLINNQQKDQLVDLTLQQLSKETMPLLATEPAESALFARRRQRAFVKVQDGCRYRCTFCIVTIARGNEKSRAVKTIIEEINTLHDTGINEVIITGVHLGGYGSDIDSSLYALVDSILEHTSIPRIRMGSLEPWDLPPEFFNLFKNTRLMPHMHLPMQSGSDSVLKRMSRRCKTSEFKALVEKARRLIPNISITSDIIVGFPGETDEEWQQTLTFVDEIGFSDLHIFTYSPREGTKAAKMPDQISNEVKKQRSKLLHQQAENKKNSAMHLMLGQRCEVLWEENLQLNSDGSTTVSGYTPNYLRVKTTTNTPDTLVNHITQCKVTSIENNVLVSTNIESNK